MSFTKLLRTAIVAASIITQGTLTAQTPGLSHTATWNNAGVTFIAQTLDVTDTASAAGSLLARWRVGGVTQFSVSKAGAVTAGAASFTTGAFSSTLTLSGNTLVGAGTFTKAAGANNSLKFDNGAGTGSIKFYTANSTNFGLDGVGGVLRIVSNLDEAGGAVIGSFATTGFDVATGTLSVATNKFTVAAATGNTVVAGTLGVTGDFALNANKVQFTASTGAATFASTVAVTSTASIYGAIAVPATAGAAAAGTPLVLYSGLLTIEATSNAPTHTRPKGSLCINTGGSSTTTRLYVNTDGAGTWTPFTTSA